MLTEEHRVVAFAHVSNVLGSILDARRAADIAHCKGALLLLDGCQAVPRLSVNIVNFGADFYAYSGAQALRPDRHRLPVGPRRLLDSLPPWQGGGSMIDRVTFEKTTYLDPPARFEAGTPHIVGAVGLHAAVNWVEKLGLDAIHAHECALVAECRDALRNIGGVTLYGPDDSAGIVSFNVDGVHAHDTATILDDAGVAVRAGHHCAQPLMDWLGVAGDCTRELRGAQRQLGHRGSGARHRAGEADFRMNRGTQDRDRRGRGGAPPPRARVTPEFERKKDYLAGFLAGEKEEEPKGGAGRRPPGDRRRSAEVDLRSRNPGRHL